MMTRHIPESNILKPKDPTKIEDEWPIFVLSDAIVYRPDGVTMANAVLVAQEGPCIVRGRLEVEDEEDFQYRELRSCCGSYTLCLALYCLFRF